MHQIFLWKKRSNTILISDVWDKSVSWITHRGLARRFLFQLFVGEDLTRLYILAKGPVTVLRVPTMQSHWRQHKHELQYLAEAFDHSIPGIYAMSVILIPPNEKPIPLSYYFTQSKTVYIFFPMLPSNEKLRTISSKNINENLNTILLSNNFNQWEAAWYKIILTN